MISPERTVHTFHISARTNVFVTSSNAIN